MKTFINTLFTLVRTAFVFILMTLSLTVTAKDIKGIIRNKQSQNPIEGVAIQVYSDSFETSALSNMEGYFQVTLPPNIDSVKIVFTHVAYHSHTSSIGIDTLLNINLIPRDNLMDEIVVKASYITRKDGVSTVNAAAIPNADKLQTSQMLKHIPGVIQSDKGIYTLNGKSATIFINGIEQKISSTSLDAFLSALPANAVTSVELIPINTGKYKSTIDAVINIKTTNNVPLGYTIQPYTYAYYKDGEIDNVGANLFYMTKINRILFHNTLSYSNESNRAISTDSLFLGKNLFSSNKSSTEGRTNVLTYQANLTYNFKNEDYLSLDAFVYNDFSETKSEWAAPLYITNEERNSRSDLYNLCSSYHIPNTKKTFNGTISYSISYGGRHADMNYPVAKQGAETQGYTDMEGWMNLLSADFSSLTDKWTFHYGAQVEYNSVWDKSSYETSLNGTDLSLMTGREILSSLYAQSTYKFNDKLNLRINARMEHTDYKYERGMDEPRSTSYIDFFPSLILSYDSKNYNLQVGAISQTIRPNYNDMLPGLDKVNDYIYQRGNPDMKPSNNYTIVLYNTFGGFLEANFNYAYVNNAVTEEYDVSDDKIVISKGNKADLRTFIANIVLPFSFMNNKLTGQLQFNTIHKKIFSFKDNFRIPDNRKDNFWRISYNAIVNYNPIDRWNITTSASYVPSTKAIMSNSNKTLSVGCDISCTLLKDKSLILSLYASDLFNVDKVTESFFLSNKHFSIKENLGPTVGLSLRWKFNKGQNVDEEYRNYIPKTSRF